MSQIFRTIAQVENLREAFKGIKNDGAPGDDGVTKEDYAIGLDGRLEGLAERLLEGNYEHGPILRRCITKANGKERRIGLLRVEDKVVQRAVLRVFGPKLEAEFSECSFARTGLGRRAASDYVYTGLFESGYEWWAQIDLTDCYGSLRVADLCCWLDVRLSDPQIFDERLGRLFYQLIRPEVHELDGSKCPRIRGVEQGMPLSMLLANLYLHEALEVPLQAREDDGDVVYARYMDDIIVGAASKSDLDTTVAKIRSLITDNGLEVNEDKYEEVHLDAADTSMTYMGTTFTRTEMPSGRAAWLRSDGQ